LEKSQRRGEPRALVAIDERVILDDMEEIGSGHGEPVCVEELSTEGGHRLTHGGFQKAPVPDTIDATELVELKLMDLDDIVDVEEFGVHSASFLSVFRWVSVTRLAASRTLALCPDASSPSSGVITRALLPSLAISTLSGVSAVIPSRSRTGR